MYHCRSLSSCWHSLRWLLILSLLFQSVGPAALAAGSTTHFNAPDPNTQSGIWTISCTGKPMWLPFPLRALESDKIGGPLSSLPRTNDHSNDGNIRHCLICNTSATTDTLSATTDYFYFNLSNAAALYDHHTVANAVVPVQSPYHSRAPPRISRT